jgi:hypothetical protein
MEALPYPLSSRANPDFLPRGTGHGSVCAFLLRKGACISRNPISSTGNPGKPRDLQFCRPVLEMFFDRARMRVEVKACRAYRCPSLGRADVWRSALRASKPRPLPRKTFLGKVLGTAADAEERLTHRQPVCCRLNVLTRAKRLSEPGSFQLGDRGRRLLPAANTFPKKSGSCYRYSNRKHLFTHQCF